MPEYSKPKSKAEFDKNFEQEYPLMNDTEAHYESSRCLFCYDAPCVQACPTGIDIPLFIKQINTDNTIGAAKTIYESNYFGSACGKVCPTEVLCEGACVYNHQDVPPIDIGRLQNYASQTAINQKAKLFKPGKSNGKKVAIIGAGPAGISCACELRTLGYKVDIYEAKAHPSGLTIYGIAPYKITNEEVLDEIAYLEKQLGFNIHYNKPITERKQLEKLEKKYDAIFLGIGLGETRNLNLSGERNKNIYGAVEFIEKLRMKQHKLKVGETVIVLGGGNTAMDAASESARMGAKKVILAYRRSKEEKGAYAFEYELAKKVGVEGMFNVTPVGIVSDGKGKVAGVRFVKTKTVKGKLTNIEGSSFIEYCDMVIKATGQSKQIDFLKKINGLELDKKGRIKTNDVFQTTNPKYFAAGDSVNGGAEVVNAVAEAKKAAQGIHQSLNGE